MAENNDRVVYPDEVEAVKEAASKSTDVEGEDYNSIEQSAEYAAASTGTDNPQISMRNMIVVPDNCPNGQKLINGVCREVFD